MGALEASTALISGASRGLGYVLARFLASRGCRLVITAREGAPLLSAARELERFAPVTAIPGDVRDPLHRSALVAAVGERLDLLINNASDLGTSPLPPLVEYDLGRFREVLDANVIAPLALVQAAAGPLRRAEGRIINISSDAARGGYPGWGAYGASKAALELLSLTLAAELEGIAVATVDPGDMRTAMHQAAFPNEDISDRKLPEETLPFWAWLLERSPTEIDGRRFEAQAEVWELA